MHLFQRVEAVIDNIHLLGFGFIDVREERSGTITMNFRLDRRRSCTPTQVVDEAAAIGGFVSNARQVLGVACLQIERAAGLPPPE